MEKLGKLLGVLVGGVSGDVGGSAWVSRQVGADLRVVLVAVRRAEGE